MIIDFYGVRPRKDHRGADLIPMRCHSVGCGMASRTRSTMQSDTRRTAADHMTLSSAFMMPLAT
jgi:hypothetical protein